MHRPVQVNSHMTDYEKTSRYRYVILMLTWFAYVVASASRLSIAPLALYMIPDLGLTRAELGLFYSFTYLGYIFAKCPLDGALIGSAYDHFSSLRKLRSQAPTC